MSVLSHEDKIRQAFEAFDTDSSGSLSVSELAGVLRRPGGGNPLSDDEIAAVIEMFDVNGDGTLEPRRTDLVCLMV